jgi:hypothetical protein
MKTVIIIPYRNRETHLSYWLKNTYPLITAVTKDVEVIIVEQAEGKQFNRGITSNIGYLYYNNPDYNYIVHDVDINPIDKELIAEYGKNAGDDKFIAVYSAKNTLGGISKFKGKTFKKVNGFPNDFWGWGHEDKDLLNRAKFYNCIIERKIDKNSADDAKLKIFNDNHIRRENNKHHFVYVLWPKLSKTQRENYIKSNGLSTLKYNLLSEETLMDGVKKIIVEV